jgi:hypothetical protein
VAERRPCGSDRVESVVFALQPPLASWAAASLEHPLAAAAQIASEGSAVMAGSLNCADAPAARVGVREPQRLRVAARVRSDRTPSDNRARRRDNDREHVLIPMRVDADHVIQLICKHPVRSSGFTRRVQWRRSECTETAAAGL